MATSMPGGLFSIDEYQARWRAVYRAMKARGLESAVVWSRGGGSWDRFQETFYLTNYYSCNSGYMYDGMQKGTRAAAHCAVILKRNEEPILIADDPTLDRRGIATTRIDAGTDVVALLAAALEREALEGTVGLVGSDCISAKHMAALRDLAPAIIWREEDDLVLDVRVIKSRAELDVFRYGGETVSSALSSL